MTTDIQLTLDLPGHDWEAVLRALAAARHNELDDAEQVRLETAYNLIDEALSGSATQRLLDSPMEVQSTIPIQVKVVKGTWQ